jgi:hypothetical protein
MLLRDAVPLIADQWFARRPITGRCPMADTASRSNKNRRILVLAIAAVLVAAGIFAGVTLVNQDPTESISDRATSTPTPEATASPTDTNTEGGTVEPSPAFGSVLPETMGGEEAIEALGENLQVVAQRNGKTAEELTQLLLRDKTAKISPEGFIVYLDDFHNEE